VIACGGAKTGGVAAAAGDDISKCEAGDGEACATLGALNEGEKLGGSGGNAPLAFAYYKKACAAKSWRGCNGLADLYDYGHGTPEDKAAAGKYHDLACANGYALSCMARARLYDSWLKGCDPAWNDTSTYKRPRDCKGHTLEASQKMLALLRKACGLDKDLGCDVVKAYDAKPGSVGIETDGIRDVWHFEDPAVGEPDWDSFEQK
jgi:TPR repeat protein